ncbi:MAG: FliH/SctL family protein [Phycisphaerales bacterium JB040]
MALIPHAQADRLVKQAVPLDLADQQRRADRLRLEAQREAESVLARAREEARALLDEARERGREEGLDRGLREGLERGREQGRDEALGSLRETIERLSEAWGRTLADFDERREAMLTDARTDVLRLAVAIAERVTHRAIEVDPGAASRQLEHCLELLTRPTQLRVAVHPGDLASLREALPGIVARFEHAMHAELIEDASLSPGSVVLRTESGGVIDASVRAQFDRIARELLPGGGDA